LPSVLSFDVVGKCFAEDSAHDIVNSEVEVEALVLAFGGPTEAGLEGEAVYQIELSPHHHTRSRLSRFLNLKTAIFITEILIIFTVKPSVL
jgi:hypothetical protein